MGRPTLESISQISHDICADKVTDAAALFAPLLEKTLRISTKNQSALCLDGDNPEKNRHMTRNVAGAACGAVINQRS